MIFLADRFFVAKWKLQIFFSEKKHGMMDGRIFFNTLSTSSHVLGVMYIIYSMAHQQRPQPPGRRQNPSTPLPQDDEPTKQLQCGHYYHRDCIIAWCHKRIQKELRWFNAFLKGDKSVTK